MNPKSPKAYAENLEALARDGFSKHVVKSTNGVDRWVIAQPGTNNFITEIALVAFGQILVHGDGPDALFGRCSYSGGRLISWLANSDPDYLASKVIAGDAKRWDDEVALWWLDSEAEEERRHLDGATGEDGTDEDEAACARKMLEGIEEMREQLVNGSLDASMFRAMAYELSNDGEWGMNAGEEPDSNIFYAREAARTLVRLLDARKGETK